MSATESAAVHGLLVEIERYYDHVPRRACRVEDFSPFALFVQTGAGWPYYARPSLGATQFTTADVARVRARQRQLNIPQAFEWVHDTTPLLQAVALQSGLQVNRHPLMVLQGPPVYDLAEAAGVSVRLVTEDDDIALFGSVAHVGFSHPGTERGEAGIADANHLAADRLPVSLDFERERIRAGVTVMAVALLDGMPVAVGSHQPMGSVTELVGIATLPAYRRRGIAGILTAFLVRDALARGVRTIVLTAGNDDVARVYQRIGFNQIGTACIAQPVDEGVLDAPGNSS